jgi:hypothetical protein
MNPKHGSADPVLPTEGPSVSVPPRRSAAPQRMDRGNPLSPWLVLAPSCHLSDGTWKMARTAPGRRGINAGCDRAVAGLCDGDDLDPLGGRPHCRRMERAARIARVNSSRCVHLPEIVGAGKSVQFQNGSVLAIPLPELC